jgi:TetR/AcrR family transcriptional regulator, transcriptional repressor for nem operon
VEHAAALVAERGVAGTSLDEVLAASGAGKSQLYHYFSDRDGLIAAAVEHRCAQVVEELTGMLGSVATLADLRQVLAAYVAEYGRRLSGCPIGTLAGEVAERNEGARERVAAAFDAWEGLFAGAFARMRERGELPASVSPSSLATALLASLEGGMLLSQVRRDVTSLRATVDMTLAHLEQMARHDR